MKLQLDTSRKEVVQSVEMVSEDEMNLKPTDTTWSISQVLEHLYKTEKEITKAIHYTLTLPEQEPLPDKPIALTLDRTFKIKAKNSIVPSEKKMNKQQLLTDLESSRKELFTLIDSIPNDIDLTTRGFIHPAFKTLSLKQWIEFIGYHERRHLEQIHEIKDAVRKRNTSAQSKS
ncbi:DinB family protein [Bacillus weihaiensis]|uniref:DinB-like domain-containing protein n=1 Tax=Bacillus weihaiensis TaxID=1547283 RepID=A0A1L3MNN1_9BACI|nr:DinB family protein [Bacillus weihaiensis]APH03953.1 hypothetical protein A9C19_03795 [Bacillus weihaiensis]